MVHKAGESHRWLAVAQLQLNPRSPPSADLGGEGPHMRYRPVQLGAAAALLPPHFHEEISFAESQVGPLSAGRECSAAGTSHGAAT